MSGSTTDGEAAAPPRRRAAARFIFLAMLMDVLGIGLIVPILPGLVTSFVGGNEVVGAEWYGPITALYAAMQFISAPILGALSDRFGRRPVLLFSQAGFGLDYLILGFAPNLTWLIIGRAIAGITGATITTANAYLADISTPETRSKNFGLVGAAFGLGFVLGPATGGILGKWNPRAPFFAAAALVLLNCLYGYFVLPESLPPEKRRPFRWREANPFRSLWALRRYPLVARLAVAFFALSMSQRGLESVWVLYTSHRFGWEEMQNGLSLSLVGIMAAIVQGGLIRRVVPRFGERRVILGGLMLSSLALVGYGFAPVGWVMLLIIPFGSLGSMANPALQGVVAGSVKPTEQGSVAGALGALTSLTAVFAPLLATTLFSTFSGEEAPFQLPGASFFAGSLFVLTALAVCWRVVPRGRVQRVPAGAEDTERPGREDAADASTAPGQEGSEEEPELGPAGA